MCSKFALQMELESHVDLHAELVSVTSKKYFVDHGMALRPAALVRPNMEAPCAPPVFPISVLEAEKWALPIL
jgi:hypothetical protein